MCYFKKEDENFGMLYKISKFISLKICLENKYNVNIVAYGCEILLSTIINLVFLLAVSKLFGYINFMVIFIIFFGLLRLSAGGYHAKNHSLCFIYYFFISSTCIFVTHIIAITMLPYIIIFFSLISTIIIYIYAPSSCANRPINKKENRLFKKRSRYTIAVLLTLIVLMSWTSFWQYSIIAIFAVFAESLTLIKKNEVNINYEMDEKL